MTATDVRGAMSRPVARVAWGAVTIGLAVAGCSSTSAGEAVPAPSSSGAKQASPPVESPRDVGAFGAAPCGIFSSEQIAGFGFDQPGEQRTITAGDNEECAWTDTDFNGTLVAITFPDSNILEREYANRAGYPVFEPMEIAGMSAIIRQNSAGSSRCVVVVGLAERGLNVGFTDLSEPYEDPCGAARMAAEVAVGNLPPLS